MRLTRKYVKIPIHVMIRPREGDFCYSEREFETMLLDIAAAKMAGMEGIVTGVLNPDGTVDEKRTAILVDAAAPVSYTHLDVYKRQYFGRPALRGDQVSPPSSLRNTPLTMVGVNGAPSSVA